MNTEISLKEIFYPFSWKEPLIYISFVISACLCIYLFFIHSEEIKFGIIEASRGYKVFSLFVLNWFPFAFFRFSDNIKNVESIAIRGLLLLGTIVIILLFLGFAWPYAKYDNEKIDTYWRILPIKNSPSYKIKTLLYKDIKSISRKSDNTDSDNILYILNKGGSQSIAIAGMPYKSRQMFHIILCNEYNQLKSDIEKIYGLEYLKNTNINEIEYTKYGISDAIYYTIFIWSIIIQIVCLIFYTFKIQYNVA